MTRPPAEQRPSKPIKRRLRFQQTVPLEERLAQQAKDDRDQARKLPPGRERDELLRHARRAESASRMAEWLASTDRKSGTNRNSVQFGPAGASILMPLSPREDQ